MTRLTLLRHLEIPASDPVPTDPVPVPDPMPRPQPMPDPPPDQEPIKMSHHSRRSARIRAC
ncbi:proline-rich small protein YnaL [Citrobacter tructae]|uniref:proline-rich small protein YnaL n=1 Tax=Citrobacter tructae TaxID=2562449 RepID=UPI003F55579D